MRECECECESECEGRCDDSENLHNTCNIIYTHTTIHTLFCIIYICTTYMQHACSILIESLFHLSKH